MKNVRISWDLPTTRESGFPLNVSEIAYVEVFLSADLGANFVSLNQVVPPTVDLFIPDVDVGEWIFRLVVVDTEDKQSVAVDTSVVVPDGSNPSSVVNVVVTFE